MTNKWTNLINSIIGLSAQDKLSWENGASSDEYIVGLNNIVLSMRSSSADLHFKLFRQYPGEAIDRFTDEDLLIDYDELSRFYHSVIRKTSGADKALDETLKFLEGLEDDE